MSQTLYAWADRGKPYVLMCKIQDYVWPNSVSLVRWQNWSMKGRYLPKSRLKTSFLLSKGPHLGPGGTALFLKSSIINVLQYSKNMCKALLNNDYEPFILWSWPRHNFDATSSSSRTVTYPTTQLTWSFSTVALPRSSCTRFVHRSYAVLASSRMSSVWFPIPSATFLTSSMTP